RRVHARRVFLVGGVHRQPDRTVLRLHARAILLGGIDRGLTRGLVGGRFELAILRDAIQVREAGALHRERLLARIARAVVADHLVRALLNRLVGVVGLPLDDRGAFLHVAWRGHERALDAFRVRWLRERG